MTEHTLPIETAAERAAAKAAERRVAEHHKAKAPASRPPVPISPDGKLTPAQNKETDKLKPHQVLEIVRMAFENLRVDLAKRFGTLGDEFRTSRLDSAEAAELVSRSIAREAIDGPMSVYRRESFRDLQEAQKAVDKYLADAQQARTAFAASWTMVHRAYVHLHHRKVSDSLARSILPGQTAAAGRPRLAITDALFNALVPVRAACQDLTSDAVGGLAAIDEAPVDLSEPPSQLLATAVLPTALPQWRRAVDRLASSGELQGPALDTERDLLRSAITKIRRTIASLSDDVRDGAAALDALGNGALPVSYNDRSGKAFDAATAPRNDSENKAALVSVLEQQARYLGEEDA